VERNNKSYYKTNTITTWIKHVDVNPIMIAKMFEEEINSVVKGVLKRQPTKRNLRCLAMQYRKNIGAKYLFKKDDVQQKQFMQNLVLLIVKNYLLFNLCTEHG
jgi:hypothetical protein